MEEQLIWFWRVFRQEFSGQRALGFVRRLWENDRWADFARFAKTADEVAGLLDGFGLADVQRVDVPADGRYRVGDWIMPLAWDCHEATIEIIEPTVEQPLLARRSDTPNVAGQWCMPTPPEGLVAECVFLRRGDPGELEGLDLAGKVVCTPGQARQIRRLLAERAALGCLTCWTRNERLFDATPWVNVASDRPGGWAMTAADSRQLSLAISRRQMQRLVELNERHGRVRLKITVEARLYEGSLPYVTARLAGRELAEQELIILGHLFEQGANDNASGCATILEIARSLASLVAAGRLQRPRRSIRFLLMGESYGSLAYAVQHRQRMQQTLAGLCVDTGAGPPERARCEIRINATPLCSRSFLDGWHVAVARAYVQRYQPLRRVRLVPFSMSTDQMFNDPLIGVPTNWVMLNAADDVWHCSADRLETLDARAYEDLGCIEAATLYGLANAGADEAVLAAELALLHARRQLQERLDEVLLGRASAPAAGPLQRLIEALAGSVRSAGRLLPGRNDRASQAIEAAACAFLEQADRQRQSLAGALRRLGRETTGEGASGEPQWNHQAERIVPERDGRIIGTVSLDPVPVQRWADGGVSTSPRWGGPRTLAWWWTDGRRSLRQIREAILAEGADLQDVDLLQYFRFLAEHGYVRFKGT